MKGKMSQKFGIFEIVESVPDLNCFLYVFANLHNLRYVHLYN